MRDIPRLKAEFFKALGHPLRIRALELLAERERSVSSLAEAMDVEQPALSQQLGILRRAGFVVAPPPPAAAGPSRPGVFWGPPRAGLTSLPPPPPPGSPPLLPVPGKFFWKIT